MVCSKLTPVAKKPEIVGMRLSNPQHHRMVFLSLGPSARLACPVMVLINFYSIVWGRVTHFIVGILGSVS